MNMFLANQAEDTAETGGVVKGVAIGIVTKNDDKDGMARVKVRFPWREKPDESYWARLAVPGAGADRGLYCVPEIGDEVLVVFERGDIRHPYILGGLWNGKDRSPATNSDGNNDIRKIKTRSGHEIIFDDASDGSVKLLTASGEELYLDRHRLHVTDGGANALEIDLDSGGVTLKSAQSVKIESQSIDIQAGATMTLQSKGTLAIKGSLVQIN